ncbi:endo alpha-1,4 polygalactosaminidase [Actinoplanes sp. NPDC049681]|uniref:endo alpha-1,4 polygalactosaminidase n=1 Tax=Actinoplanes sp. NPDC049681 TaxID=3363905 RepID=UPI00379F1F01
MSERRGLLAVLGGFAVAVLAVAAVALATRHADASTDSPHPAGVAVPPANAPFDYQIGAAYQPPAGVQVVSRDREAAPAGGLYTICYVNAFQVQPDELGWWRSHHEDLLLKDANGTYVVDTDWDENLLDISTAAKRAEVADIVGGWMDDCAERGFRAVEPDNLDSYERSQGLLTRTDAVAMANLLAVRAHTRNLAIGQKNAAGLGTSGRAAGLDFAIVEECGQYSECGDYVAVYGNQVIDVEYTKAGFTKACRSHGATLSIVRRDRDVSAPGTRSYVYDAC